eukprot:gnl/MRDRNA2_/MRDRNA2_56907_c0_seq1.p1 gnl/MRDRNA2_/MRDRNA2_56907_c0~~gnl/MRDRNA2_/MRDRNA2_56907_c0_seq1.p1  ORF type:complete len:147 (-),score=29.50 gnl/MRDRNA2_/MRDRNA2_56907_c0_seq1:100-540(-)
MAPPEATFAQSARSTTSTIASFVSSGREPSSIAQAASDVPHSSNGISSMVLNRADVGGRVITNNGSFVAGTALQRHEHQGTCSLGNELDRYRRENKQLQERLKSSEDKLLRALAHEESLTAERDELRSFMAQIDAVLTLHEVTHQV